MKKMPPRRTIFKMGLVGFALLAVVGFAAAQALGATDKVLLLQARRFEGAFKLPTGETNVRVGDEKADWNVAAGGTSLSAALAPQAGKPSRATLNVDGRTVEGKATIEGRTLTFDFVDGKTSYHIKLSLSGRNEGEISVTKNNAVLIAGAFKRA